MVDHYSPPDLSAGLITRDHLVLIQHHAAEQRQRRVLAVGAGAVVGGGAGADPGGKGECRGA